MDGSGSVKEASNSASRDWSKWPEQGTLVTYWKVQSGRYISECLFGDRSRYLQLWKQGLLEHQREGKKKPDYLPLPEDLMT